MTSLQEVRRAKKAYEDYVAVRPSSLNPWLGPDDKLELDKVMVGLEKPIKLSEGAWKCASPWHAFFALTALQIDQFRQNKRYLFRGHRDSSWQIQSSVSRPTANPTFAEKQKRELISVLTKVTLNKISFPTGGAALTFGIDIEDLCGEAIAQHYGIATSLIDFTTDPAVAVFFACLNAPRNESTIGSVFSLPYETAMKSGLTIVVPPPYAERVYVQQGLFIQYEGVVDRNLIRMAEFRFPNGLIYDGVEVDPFAVLRHGEGEIAILADPTGLNEITSPILAGKSYTDVEAWDAAIAFTDNLLRRYGNPLTMWVTFLDGFVDLVDSLAMVLQNGNHYVDKGRLEFICFSNRLVAGEMVNVGIWALDQILSARGTLEAAEERTVRLLLLVKDILGKDPSMASIQKSTG